MKTIGGWEFPETPEEAAEWLPVTYRVALHRDVLVAFFLAIADNSGGWVGQLS